MNGSANGSVQTAATGTNYATLPAQYCRRVHLINDTGVDLEVRQDAAGVALPIFNGTGFSFNGLDNANQLAVRRVDQSNTQLTVKYRWEYR